MDQQILSALIPNADATTKSSIGKILDRFGAPILALCANARVTIHALAVGERYDAASTALKRLGVDVDAWPAPPAGLFVVEERRVYLRSRSAMTIAHEFAHALDCALGGGIYRSSTDLEIRAAFSNATSFVTPYAATAIDEYFAECVRAHVEANDPASFWPRATRERLHRVDPVMASIIADIFSYRSP